MFLSRRYRRRPEFSEGVRAALPVAAGIAAWGLMTGVAMVQAGLSVVQAVAMTLIAYAGSAQLAAVPLMVGGAPVWVVLAAATCVNLRFVVFSAHLRAYLMHLPLRERLLTGYLTGDVTYVLFVRRYQEPAATVPEREHQLAYLLGSCLVNYLAWVIPSIAGILLAHAIPPSWGLGFAGLLALLALCAALATTRLRMLSAGVASVAAVAAWALPLKLNILVAILAAVAACLWVESHGPGWLRGRPLVERSKAGR
jgi:predicted branched-subunit amino acid permease